MKIPLLILSSVFCMAMLAGCAEHPMAESTGDYRDTLAPPQITNAVWSDNDPSMVEITGLYFKNPSSSKQDVLASINCRNWKPALLISDSSVKHYSAVLPYGVNFKQVWVRVYGVNEKYSEPFIVAWRKP